MCLAIPGKIVALSGKGSFSRMGKVTYGGITKEASLAFVPEAIEGDYIIVHAGVAISIIKEEEAQKTFEYLDQISEVEV